MPPKRSPSTHVLETTELLETILLELPMKDLLLSQRVCRLWHALITTSIRLRRALFLEPVPCGTISYLDWRLDDKDFYDENHARLGLGEDIRGPNCDQMPKVYPSHWGRSREDSGKYHVFVNPLLEKLFPVLSVSGIYWKEQLEDLPKPVQTQHASWRRMYFTQPPVNCMALECDSDGDEDSADWTITWIQKIHYHKGLTMAELAAQLFNVARPAWIEGRHLWEEYRGSHDLAKVVVDADNQESSSNR